MLGFVTVSEQFDNGQQIQGTQQFCFLKPSWAFAEHFLGIKQIFEYHIHFKAGERSVQDECSGQPIISKTPENIEKIWRIGDTG